MTVFSTRALYAFSQNAICSSRDILSTAVVRLQGDEAVELAPFGFEGAIVDVPVPDVEIEQLIEGLAARAVGQRFLCGRRRRRARAASRAAAISDTHVFDYNRWLEEPGESGVEELRLLEVRQMAGAWYHRQLGTGDACAHLLRVRGRRQRVLGRRRR